MLTTIQFAFYAVIIGALLPVAKDLAVLGALKLENAIFEEVEA